MKPLSKKSVSKFFSIFVTLLFLCPAVALAHPGGTDSDGGHTDRSTGIYHYHHGYSAHQHTGGICPYDYEDISDEEYNKKPSDYLKQNSVTSYDSNGWRITPSTPGENKATAKRPVAEPDAVEDFSPVPTIVLFVGSVAIICFVFRKKGKPALETNVATLAQGNQTLQHENHLILTKYDSVRKENTNLRKQVQTLQATINHLERQVSSPSPEQTEQILMDKIHGLRKRPQYEHIPLFAEFAKDICNEKLLSAAQEKMAVKNISVSAKITSESKNTYVTTLTSCTCADFHHRKHPCKHMYRLALEIGLLANTPMSDYIEILNAIKEEKDALKKLQSKPKK